MSSPRKIRSMPAREALLDAARLVFAEQGYASSTTREIARRAGVSEVMLFRRFGSKSNLFKEAVFQPLDRNMIEFKAGLFGAGGERARLSAPAWRAYSGHLLGFLEENRPLFTALIVASATERSDTMNVGDLTSLDEYFAHATEALALSMTDEERSDIGDPAIVVRLTFSLVAALALFDDWLFPRTLMDRREVIDVMTRFAERALGMWPAGDGDPPTTDSSSPPATPKR